MNEVLRDVSRSFYLTIRMLPRRLREPIGTAYLLARASDTIADSSSAPAARRRQHLAAFAEIVRSAEPDGLEEISRETESSHPGEMELMRRLPEAIAAHAALRPEDRAEVTRVMEKIVRGQDLDIERFGENAGGLATPGELEEYAYLVAGCVGEFWTNVCLSHLPRYSRLDAAELTRHAIAYGKGLQLVNILRDLRADLDQGRCYLTEPSGDPCKDARPSREAVGHWLQRARVLVDSGRIYTASLRPARIRAACFLPWTLAVQTLDLLEVRSPLDTPHKVKVSRQTVRAALFRSLVAAFSNSPFHRAP